MHMNCNTVEAIALVIGSLQLANGLSHVKCI